MPAIRTLLASLVLGFATLGACCDTGLGQINLCVADVVLIDKYLHSSSTNPVYLYL